MFDKKLYWKRRKDGKRGQENLTPEPVLFKESGVTTSFDNQGRMLINNRAYRRRAVKLPSTLFKVLERKKAAHKKRHAANLRREARQERLAKV